MSLTKVTYSMIDGGWINPADYSSLIDAIAAAKANNMIVCLFEDTTIQVPTNAATLQDVFDYVATSATQVQVTVNLATGYQIASSLTLSNGDWSNFNITSTDATVYLTSGFVYTDNIFNFDRAIAPKISILIDAQGKGRHGINANNCSSIYVASGKGVKYAGYIGCYVNAGSTGYIDSADFSYAGVLSTDPTYIAGATGVSARRGSLLDARAVTVNNSKHYGMSSDQSSKINAQSAVANDCLSYGIRADEASEICAQYASANNCQIGFYALGGSTISADSTSATGCTSRGYYAANSSTINAYSGDASNAGENGFFALDNSKINATSATANTCGTNGFYAQRSSTIEAHSSTATGNTSAGFSAQQGSIINAESATATDNGTYGFFTSRASIINANGATATGNATSNVYAERASTINFVSGIGASTTTLDNIYVSNGGIVAAGSATGTLRIAANTLTASGIIFQ